jgi:RNA polymerase sigma-70 factor (ECF subfamily)
VHEHGWLAAQFDTHRDHLRGVAYRLLGSAAEADDALQDAWIRVSQADANDVENVGGWLTTIVSRVCLDMLRSRESRREDSLEVAASVRDPRGDPEHDALRSDSVGVALLVVLDTLAPIERTPAAARQIASRARRRVRGPSRGAGDATDAAHQRTLVEAFVSALRAGDLDALLRVLDPDFVFRADASVAGVASETRGAEAWARQAIGGARAFARGLQSVQPILVNGTPALVFAPRGRLKRVLLFAIVEDRIVAADLIGDPARLDTLELSAPHL